MHAAVPKSQFTGSTSEALFELASSKRRKITLITFFKKITLIKLIIIIFFLM